MSSDELFQILIRTVAAGVWLVIVIRVMLGRMDTDRLDALIATFVLALVLTVIAVGGYVTAVHLVPGVWVRVAYTAATSVALTAGAVVLVRK